MDLLIIGVLSGLLGLAVGSFLSVVITRYPVMLQKKWRTECREYLNLPIESASKTFNLVLPRSHCPHCHTPLKARHNIPIISYCWLRGRCAYCRQKIACFYPTVELISALATVSVILHFAITWKTLAAWILTWVLIALSFIDFKTQLIPDDISLSTLWLGLFLSLFHVFITPNEAIAGALLGYGLLWITAHLFKWIRKKEGLGQGDCKMLGMLGAWLGVTAVFNILLIATVLGLIYGSVLLLMRKINRQQPIPFGPFIAIAGWLNLLLGPFLWYAIITIPS